MAGTAQSSRTGGDGVEGAAINRNRQSYSCQEQSSPFPWSHEASGMPSSRPTPAAKASGRPSHLTSPFAAYPLTFTNYPSQLAPTTLTLVLALPWNLPAKYFLPALPLGLHQDILVAVFATSPSHPGWTPSVISLRERAEILSSPLPGAPVSVVSWALSHGWQVTWERWPTKVWMFYVPFCGILLSRCLRNLESDFFFSLRHCFLGFFSSYVILTLCISFLEVCGWSWSRLRIFTQQPVTEFAQLLWLFCGERMIW